jgi:hypothetical protein
MYDFLTTKTFVKREENVDFYENFSNHIHICLNWSSLVLTQAWDKRMASSIKDWSGYFQWLTRCSSEVGGTRQPHNLPPPKFIAGEINYSENLSLVAQSEASQWIL